MARSRTAAQPAVVIMPATSIASLTATRTSPLRRAAGGSNRAIQLVTRRLYGSRLPGNQAVLSGFGSGSSAGRAGWRARPVG